MTKLFYRLSFSECPPLKTELLKGGSYKCMFQGQEIKEMLQYPEYPAGSSCTLECEPGLFERPMFAGNKIYCIEEFDGTKEGCKKVLVKIKQFFFLL